MSFNIKFLLGLISICLSSLSALRAQQGVAVSGSTAEGEDGIITYTIGQVDYINADSNEASVSLGLQQPYEFYIIPELKHPDLHCDFELSPNPATDFLILKSGICPIEDLSYSIYDARGKLIMYDKILSNERTISIERLSMSVYFLIISKSQKEIKTFKIIKNER